MGGLSTSTTLFVGKARLKNISLFSPPLLFCAQNAIAKGTIHPFQLKTAENARRSRRPPLRQSTPENTLPIRWHFLTALPRPKYNPAGMAAHRPGTIGASPSTPAVLFSGKVRQKTHSLLMGIPYRPLCSKCNFERVTVHQPRGGRKLLSALTALLFDKARLKTHAPRI